MGQHRNPGSKHGYRFIAAHYNKLIAENMDEYKAWELTQSLAERVYAWMFQKNSPY
jgi:hypothetical protein